MSNAKVAHLLEVFQKWLEHAEVWDHDVKANRHTKELMLAVKDAKNDMTPYQPSTTDVMSLRTLTGLGMMQCRKALIHSHGDLNGALDYLGAARLTYI